jgi:hypothetical protein
MEVRREIPWTTLFIEGVAIVVSILLAFAIDAWWDQRKGRAEERDILLGLEIEFVDLRERLDAWAVFNQDGFEYLDRFLSDSAGSMDSSEFEQVFIRSILVNVLDQGGPLDALLASGRLEKIQDDAIRARLAKWPDWLEDIHTNDLSIRDFAWREIAPTLARHGIPDSICPQLEFYCREPEPAPDKYREMAADSQLRALLTMRRMLMGMNARDHADARDRADETLNLIRARLDQLQE